MTGELYKDLLAISKQLSEALASIDRASNKFLDSMKEAERGLSEVPQKVADRVLKRGNEDNNS